MKRNHKTYAAVVLAACSAVPAFGANDTWTGGSGLWSAGSNWSLGTAPATGDAASLTRSDAISRTVTFDVSSASVSGLNIGITGGGQMTLVQAGGTLGVTGQANLGNTGRGTYVQSGGALTVTGQLMMGNGAGGSGGSYVLSDGTGSVGSLWIGGASGVTVSGTGNLGVSGALTLNGTLVMSGGMLTTGSLFSTTTNSFSWTGGTVAVTGFSGMDLGLAGLGTAVTVGTGQNLSVTNTLTVSNALTLTAGGAVTAGKLYLPNLNGSITLNGGTLTVGMMDTINNPGHLYWTAGTVVVPGGAGLTLSKENLGTSVGLGAGKTLSVANTLTVPSGTGVTLSGGVVSVGSMSTTGTFSWTGGTAAFTGAGGLTQGAGNVGTSVTLSTGKTLSVTRGLSIPAGSSLTVASNGAVSAEEINTTGTGFTWTGGRVSITGDSGLTLAVTNVGATVGLPAGKTLAVTNALGIPAGTGVTLSGGVLQAASVDTTGNPSGLTWTSGTVEVTGDAGLTPAATNVGANVTLSSGKTLSVTNTLSLPAGTGLTVSGGAVSAAAIDATGNPGALSWGTGSVSITGSGGLTLGNDTVGSSVTLTTSKSLIVRNTLGVPTGTGLRMNGGFAQAGTVDVDGGTMTHSSGTLTATQDVYLRDSAGGGGAFYSIGNGRMTAANVYVGGNGTASDGAGQLDIGGGTFGTTGTLKVWNDASQVTLHGGTLAVGSFDVGSASRFAWTAGTLSVTGAGGMTLSNSNLGTDLTLGVTLGRPMSLVVGNYLLAPAGSNLTLKGGTLSVGTGKLYLAATTTNVTFPGSITAGTEYVGYQGSTSTLNLPTGSNTVAGAPDSALYVGSGGSTGTYNVVGNGIVTAANIYVGGDEVGASGVGAMAIGGTANVSASANFTVWNTGQLTMSGGKLTAQAFKSAGQASMSGGTLVTGSLEGSGGIAWTGGTISVTGSGGLTLPALGPAVTVEAAKSLYVAGTLAVPAGTSLALNGGTLSVGDLSVAGNVSWGSGTLKLNEATAQLVLPGPLGASLDLDAGKTLVAAGGVAVRQGAEFTFDGGYLTTNGISNRGSLTYQSGTLVLTPQPPIGYNSVLNYGSATFNADFGSKVVRNESEFTNGKTVSGQMVFNTAQHLAQLWVDAGTVELAAGGDGSWLVKTSALSVSSGAKLSIGDNAMMVGVNGIVTNQLSLIRSRLASGYNGGAWTGAGIMSYTAAADGTRTTAVGYADTLDLGYTSFYGESIVGEAVLLRYTYYGDVNLDGRVNGDDYARMDRAAAKGLAAAWVTGDFNYDGVVTAADWFLMDKAFGLLNGGLSPELLAEREARFGEGYVAELVTAVPEPGVVGLVIGVMGVGVGRRRRR